MTRARTQPQDQGPRAVRASVDSGSDRTGSSQPRHPGASLDFADSDILTDTKGDRASRIGPGRVRRPAKA